MRSLLKDSKENKWYPHSIDEYKSSITIPSQPREYGRYRSNFAYSMQYIEYLEKQLCELRLSSVLVTMLCKTYVLTGMSIIELIFTFILKCSGKYATSEWQEDYVTISNPKTHSDICTKIESHVFNKVDPFPVSMNLDSMLKKMESNNLLSIEHKIYPVCKYLRGLRNRVHLQEGKNSCDHDYNAFNLREVQKLRNVLYEILTCPEVCIDKKPYKFLMDSHQQYESINAIDDSK